MSAPQMQRTPTATIDKKVLNQAACWLAQLASGEADASDIAACNAWREAHPQHEQAWQLAEQLTGKLRSLPAAQALVALQRPRSTSRRAVLRGLFGLAIAAPAAGYLWRQVTIDYRTAAAERFSTKLDDGSHLLLDSATQVRIQFTAGLRRLQLLQGSLQLRTSTDSQLPQRPFVVSTEHGSAQTLDACFTVEKHDDDSCAVVESGELQLQPASAMQTQIVHAGQRARFSTSNLQPPQPLQAADLGWIRELIYAENERLQDFIDRLSRYRSGWLHCAPDVADLRISGVFRLHDTDQVLAALASTLPLRIVRIGPWTRLEAASR